MLPVNVHVGEIGTFTCTTSFTELDIEWRIRPAGELAFMETSQNVIETIINNRKASQLTLAGCPMMNNTEVVCKVSGVLSGTITPVNEFSSVVKFTIEGLLTQHNIYNIYF